MNIWIVGILMGLGGTLAMDVWAVLLYKIAGQPKPDLSMLGRWFGHGLKGKLFHQDIGKAEPVGSESPLGWFFHYAVGVVYGVFWALFAGATWLAAPTLFPVWVFAILAISAGWFFLQPGMGLGMAASKTPNPWKVRILGLLAHTMFGLGMWVVALVLA